MTTQFYKGYGNSAILSFTSDNIPVMPSAMTKVAVLTDAGSYNSTDHPNVVTINPTNVTLRLGNSSLPIGTHKASIIVYSADYPQGVVWAEGLSFSLKHPE